MVIVQPGEGLPCYPGHLLVPVIVFQPLLCCLLDLEPDTGADEESERGKDEGEAEHDGEQRGGDHNTSTGERDWEWKVVELWRTLHLNTLRDKIVSVTLID